MAWQGWREARKEGRRSLLCLRLLKAAAPARQRDQIGCVFLFLAQPKSAKTSHTAARTDDLARLLAKKDEDEGKWQAGEVIDSLKARKIWRKRERPCRIGRIEKRKREIEVTCVANASQECSLKDPT